MKASSQSGQAAKAARAAEQPSSRCSREPKQPERAAGAETTGGRVPDIKRLGMLLVRAEQQPAARLQCLESNCPIAMIDKVAHNRKLGKRLAQTAQLGEKTLGEINTRRDKKR